MNSTLLQAHHDIHSYLKDHLGLNDLSCNLWIFRDGHCIEQGDDSGIEYQQANDSLMFNLNPAALSTPFCLIHIIENHKTLSENQIRTLITVEKGHAVFLEMHLHADSFAQCHTTSTELILNEGASLQHIQIQEGNQNSSQTQSTEVKQAADSDYQGIHFAFKLGTQKSTVLLGLHHNHAKANLKALLFLKNEERANYNLTVLHQEPMCESNTLVRGVVHDQACGEFSGKIVIEEGASQSHAKLENKNILISKQAEMITRPQLEVYNDDVQCTHGATVGHIDLQALFYLTSRGIPLEEAKKMLVVSFIQPILAGLPLLLLPYIEARIHEH